MLLPKPILTKSKTYFLYKPFLFEFWAIRGISLLKQTAKFGNGHEAPLNINKIQKDTNDAFPPFLIENIYIEIRNWLKKSLKNFIKNKETSFMKFEAASYFFNQLLLLFSVFHPD